MTDNKLDYSSLEKAVTTLATAVNTFVAAQRDSLGKVDRDIMRDGIIQRFDYTFELAWKMIKRYLEMFGLEKADALNNRELFRVGFENGLIKDTKAWFDYLTDRNQTSHICDEDIASDVFASANKFLPDVQYLLSKLKERIQ